jgi:3',5'-cyclic AMP phosphodiesterase CpdA
MKIVHITDTHIVPEGETIFGIDPAARLSAVIDDVCQRHADADLAVITGDLVDRGDAVSYERARTLLARLPMPVRMTIGNHDSREAFVECYPDTPRDEAGFVQSMLDLPDGGGRLLFLDTHEPGWIGGRYCENRLTWLNARLQEAPDRPAYLFMHHPPFTPGIPHFEQICLAQPERFMAALAQHKGGVKHIFFGHLHIPVSGVSQTGIPFTGGRGCAHQVIADFINRDCTWASGAPNYNIVLIGPQGAFVHAFDLIGAAPIGTGTFPPGP